MTFGAPFWVDTSKFPLALPSAGLSLSQPFLDAVPPDLISQTDLGVVGECMKETT